MVPEHEHVMIGGVVLHAPCQEVGERVRVAHRRARLLVLEEQLAVVHLVALDLRGVDQVVLPFIGASRLQHERGALREIGFLQLDDVVGGIAGLAFQVRSAHVHEHGPGVVRADGLVGVAASRPVCADGLAASTRRAGDEQAQGQCRDDAEKGAKRVVQACCHGTNRLPFPARNACSIRWFIRHIASIAI